VRQASDRSTAGTRELRIFDEDDAAIIERLTSARGLLERLPVTFSRMPSRLGRPARGAARRRANPMSRNRDWTLYMFSVSFGLVAVFNLAISLYHTTPFAPQGAKEPRQRCLRDPACRVTFSALGSEQGQPGVGC